MTDKQQPEALRLAEILEGDYCPDWLNERGVDEVSAELRRQHARIADLEAQLEAIGAGGVSGPLIGQPQAMPDLSQLTERGAKAWAGVDAQGLREGFTAVDMATAAAQGFRDGVAKGQQAMWRHIETAPKDGQAILVTDGMDCYCVEWDEEFDWWTVDDNKLGPFRLRGSAPTHWMKLPEPPNGKN